MRLEWQEIDNFITLSVITQITLLGIYRDNYKLNNKNEVKLHEAGMVHIPDKKYATNDDDVLDYLNNNELRDNLSMITIKLGTLRVVTRNLLLGATRY